MTQTFTTPNGTGSSSLARRVTVSAVEEQVVRHWFDGYLSALSARGRGESDDVQLLLDYYAVPLTMATDDGVLTLTSEEQVVSFASQQVDGMRAAGVHQIVTLRSDVTVLNANAALLDAGFVRKSAAGDEIARLAVTYFITSGGEGLRLAALAMRAA